MNTFGKPKLVAHVQAGTRTNMAFRSDDEFEIIAPKVVQGTTNRSLNFAAFISDDEQQSLIKVLSNGTVVIHSNHHLNQIVSVGRNGRVLAILQIKMNSILINNEYHFGTFDIHNEHRHKAVMLPPRRRPAMVVSPFLHFELNAHAIVTHLETSIDGGIYLSLMFNRGVFILSRFDISSWINSLVNIIRSAHLPNGNEVLDIILGEYGRRIEHQMIDNRRMRQIHHDLDLNRNISTQNNELQPDVAAVNMPGQGNHSLIN